LFRLAAIHNVWNLHLPWVVNVLFKQLLNIHLLPLCMRDESAIETYRKKQKDDRVLVTAIRQEYFEDFFRTLAEADYDDEDDIPKTDLRLAAAKIDAFFEAI
jgi:hypothetical protein